MVALQLTSLEPILVLPDGSLWDMDVTLSEFAPSGGTMTILRDDENGGTFTSQLQVNAVFVFTPLAGGPAHTLSDGPPVELIGLNPHPWQHDPPIPDPPFPGQGPNFFPLDTVVNEETSSTDDERHRVKPGGSGGGSFCPLPPGPSAIHCHGTVACVLVSRLDQNLNLVLLVN